MYGEPLTDPRIVHLSSKIKKKLPDATLKIVTNGDFLTEEVYNQLIEAGVDFFNISKHSKKLSAPLTKLLEKLSEEEKKKRFNILDFWADFDGDQEMFNTRAGEVELKVKKVNPIMCSYVTYPVINTFGELVLCCNDYHSEYKFGNVMDRSLEEIWFDPKNIAARKRIFKGHMDYEACKNCYM
ncbi:SPASM domain-containing protein, partial [Bacteriovoracaceae bacterium]|nr:SPASM domain-containing protein [Bacteriovoracaceae bacterium]